MNNVIARWLGAVGQSAVLCALLATGTGCGAIKAAANPKVAWAVGDPAPMSVVVRRADQAEKTAQNVDRLMTETPADESSEWLGKVGPDTQAATEQLTELRKHELYVSGVRIVAAEVWAKQLAALEKKDPSKAAPVKTADAKPAEAKAATPSTTPSQPTEAPKSPVAEATTVSEPTPEPVTPKGKKGKKGKQVAKAGEPVPKKGNKKAKKGAQEAEEQAAADKAAADKAAADKAAADKAAAEQAQASAQQAQPASSSSSSSSAAPSTSATTAKYPSILAAVDKDLGEAWTKIMEKKRASGELKAEIATLEAKNDEKGIADADKKANKARIAELDKQADAIDAEAKTMKKAFIAKARASAEKTPAPLREKLGRVLVNLRQAVDDANTANSAALVRYPLAVTSMVSSAQTMAKVYAGDVVEERTGKRPDMSQIQPNVSLDGGKVSVNVNGLEAKDSKEVVTRTTKWVGRALGLVGIVAANKDVLEFEDDVLVALLDGFKAAGYAAPPPVVIPEAPAAGAPQQPQQTSARPGLPRI